MRVRHRDDGQPSDEFATAAPAIGWCASSRACHWRFTPPMNGAAIPAPCSAARRAIEHGDIIVVTMLFMEDHFQPLLEALQERREQLRRHGLRDVGGRGGAADALGRFSMDGSQSGPLALLKRLRGGKKKSRHRGRRSDEDAAADSADAALHSRHRAGCARLFPDAAILAGGLGGQHPEHGALPGRPLCRGTARRPAAGRQSAAAGRVPGSRRLPPAHAGTLQRARWRTCRSRRARRARSASADAALLSAGRQCRATTTA